MLKSIALATAVLSLNAGSFNIQPKEVVWTDNVTQDGSWLSNETINANYIDENEGQKRRNIDIFNKNTYKYKDQYVEIETTIVARITQMFYLDSNGENIENGYDTNLAISHDIYTHYKSFNTTNAQLYNIYNNQTIYTNFSDNKGTIYNYNPTTFFLNTDKIYTSTTDTKQAIANIKLAETRQQILTAQNNFRTAFNNTTNSDVTSSTINQANKNININEEIEGYENGEAYTYIRLITSTPYTLTYNNEVLTTDTQLNNWYQTFYEVINGQNVWNYKGSSTTKSTIANQVSLSVDSGTATTTEVIDIAGLMWDIIGMPFTFINQAFNVTLFAGTMYEFNIGSLIKGIIAILSLLFIIKLFTRGIDVLGAYAGKGESKLGGRKETGKIIHDKEVIVHPDNNEPGSYANKPIKSERDVGQ